MKHLSQALAVLLLPGLLLPAPAGQGRIEIAGPVTIDLGRYPASETKTASGKIRNTGRETLNIIAVQSTCGCSSVRCSKKALKPGDDADIEVTILPNSIFGPFSKNIYVESSDPVTQFLCLGLTGYAVPLIEIKPNDFIYAGRILTNASWRQSFDLTGTDPHARLGDPRIESSHPLHATLQQVGGNDSASYRFEVELLPGAEPGALKAAITIPLVTPTNQLPVRLSISGRIGAELAATPGIFRIPVSDRTEQRTFALRALGEDKRILNPGELKIQDQPGLTCDVRQDADGHSLAVTATFTPAFTKKLDSEETIPLSFSLPGLPPATVTCKAKR